MNIISSPKINGNENCNPIDLSVIIKSNLLKNSNWGDNRNPFTKGSTLVEEDKHWIRNSSICSQDSRVVDSRNNNKDCLSYNNGSNKDDNGEFLEPKIKWSILKTCKVYFLVLQPLNPETRRTLNC